MPDITVELLVIAETAVTIGAGGSSGSLADKSVIRDAARRPLIPGSQVKGKARWAAEQLLRGMGQDIPSPFDPDPDRVRKHTVVLELFGSPDHRSPLRFANLLADHTQSSILPSVSINRRRGTAEDARLLFQEAVIRGTRFHHTQAITGTLDNPGQVALLWAALCLCDRWGGATSRGLGWSEITMNVTWDGAERSRGQLAADLHALLERQD